MTTLDFLAALVESLKGIRKSSTFFKSKSKEPHVFIQEPNSKTITLLTKSLTAKPVALYESETKFPRSPVPKSPARKASLSRCYQRKFKPDEEAHKVTIISGKQCNKRVYNIPKVEFPHFIPQEYMDEILELKNTETLEEREKMQEKARESRIILVKDRNDRVTQLEAEKAPEKEKEPDLTEVLINSFQEVKTDFIKERAGIMRVRQLPVFRPFERYVLGVKCQLMRELQFRENQVKERDRKAYLNELIEDRYKQIKVMNETETALRKENIRKKKRFLNGLLCKMSEIDIKKGPLKKSEYIQNSIMRNKSQEYRQKKAIKKAIETSKEHAEWRKEMLDCTAIIYKIEKLEAAEEKYLSDREERFLAKKQSYMESRERERNSKELTRRTLIKGMFDGQLKQQKLKRIKEEIALMRARDLDEWMWRKQEEEKEQKKINARDEMRRFMEIQKNDRLAFRAMEIERDRLEADRITRENEKDYDIYLKKVKKENITRAKLLKDTQKEIEHKERIVRKKFEMRQREARNTDKRNEIERYFLNREMTMELNRLRDQEGFPKECINSVMRKFQLPPNMKVPEDALPDIVPGLIKRRFSGITLTKKNIYKLTL